MSKSLITLVTLAILCAVVVDGYSLVTSAEPAMIAAINKYRGSKRVALVKNTAATEAAREHSLNMASMGDITHDGFEDRLADLPGLCSENVAKALKSPERAQTNLQKSSGHSKNMLKTANRSVGVGIVKSVEDGTTYYYVTQIFCTGK